MKFDVTLRYVFLGIASILFVFPLYWMVTGSFKSQTEIWAIPPVWFTLHYKLDNYIHIFQTRPTLLWLFNSIFTSAATVLLVILFSTMAGYAYAKKKFPGAKLLFIVVIATMMMPHQVTLVPLYLLCRDLGIINSYWGVILPSVAYPFGVFIVKQFCSTIPDEILESAKMDGAGELRIFFMIVSPLMLPAIGALSIFAFMHTWNDYLWQLVILQSKNMLTLPLGIATITYDEHTINYGFAMAGATIAAFPLILLFLSLQKSFISGITMGSVKG
jgi:multiple sugar transport system permease protein